MFNSLMYFCIDCLLFTFHCIKFCLKKMHKIFSMKVLSLCMLQFVMPLYFFTFFFFFHLLCFVFYLNSTVGFFVSNKHTHLSHALLATNNPRYRYQTSMIKILFLYFCFLVNVLQQGEWCGLLIHCISINFNLTMKYPLLYLAFFSSSDFDCDNVCI